MKRLVFCLVLLIAPAVALAQTTRPTATGKVRLFMPGTTQVRAGEVIEIPIAVSHPGYLAIDARVRFPVLMLCEPWVMRGPAAPGPEYDVFGLRPPGQEAATPPADSWKLDQTAIGDEVRFTLWAAGPQAKALSGCPVVIRFRVREDVQLLSGRLEFSKGQFNEVDCQATGGTLEVLPPPKQ